MSSRQIAKRAGKILVYCALAITILLLFLVAVLLLPPARDRIVSRAFDVASESLPGSLSVEKTRWALPLTLSFEEALWTGESGPARQSGPDAAGEDEAEGGSGRRKHPGTSSAGETGGASRAAAETGAATPSAPQRPDTLLAVRDAELSVDILSLLKRDIRVTRLAVEGLSADVPSIRALFSTKEPAPEQPAGAEGDEGAGSTFPREGSIKGVPSIAVEEIHLRARSIRAFEGTVIEELSLVAGLDLRHGNPATARLETMTLSASADNRVFERPRITSADLALDIGSGYLSGNVAAALSPELTLFLTITPRERDHFRLLLTTQQGARPLEQVGLDLDCRLARSDGKVSGLAFEGEVLVPGTRYLAGIPGLEGKLAGYPKLEGLPMRLDGEVGFAPATSIACGADFKSNAWLDGGRARFSYGEGKVSLDTLEVSMPDLELAGSAALSPDYVRAYADLEIGGTRWLEALELGAEPLQSLAADFTLVLDGPRSAPRIRALLDASGRGGAVEIERLKLEAATPASYPSGSKPPVSVTLYANAMEMVLATTSSVALPDEETGRIAATLTPLTVRSVTEGSTREPESYLSMSRDAAESFGECAAAYAPGARKLSFENLRLTGDLGELRLDAQVPLGAQGTFDLNWTWPAPPQPIVSALAGSPEDADSLRADWSAEEGLGIAAGGTLEISGSDVAVSTAGRFTLPGPRALSTILPSGAEVKDLGPVAGRFNAGVRLPEAMFDLAASLDGTAWVDSSAISFRGAKGEVWVDSSYVSLLGLDVGLSGSQQDEVWDMRARLDMMDPELLRRFAPSLGEILDVGLRARAHLSGPAAEPALEASFLLGLITPSLEIPRVEGEASWSGGRLKAELDAVKGLIAGPVALDSLKVSYAPADTAGGLLPAQIALDASGSQINLSTASTIHALAEGGGRDLETSGGGGSETQGGGWRMETQSLRLALEERDLRSTGPFALLFVSGGERIEVRGLSLKGTLGTLAADGYVSKDGSSAMSVEADLDLPEDPPFIEVSEGLWPHSLELDASSSERAEIEAELRAKGLGLGDRRDLQVSLNVSTASGTPGALALRMTVTEGDSTIADAGAKLPADVGIYPPGVSLNEGPLSVEAALNNFPVPFANRAGTVLSETERTASLDAELILEGTAEAPSAALKGSMAFEEWPKMSGYSVGFMAEAISGVEAETQGARPGKMLEEVEAAALELPAMPSIEGSGLVAALSLRELGEERIMATVLLPATWSLFPFQLEVDKGRDLKVEVASQPLDLSDFDPLLPPRAGIGGRCRFKVVASGSSANPDLAGEIKIPEIEVSLEDGTRVSAGADIDIDGTRMNPSLDGSIEVQNGVIVIPEKSRKLHPAEGQALLWNLESVESGGKLPFAQADREGEAQPRGRLQTVPAPPKAQLDLDVQVDIPSALWIRGRGLDVELAGELRLVQRGTFPTITGELDAVQGRFVFLGQTFFVDRGTATFYGGDEINPSLDMLLTTKVGDTLIKIALLGSAFDPRIQLSSEPELPEGDIMSLLVFGRPMDQLDSDQVQLLGNRAANIATSFGAAQLEARLARQLGVDMVRITSGTEPEEGTSLIIGKYISPRVLLKYEQNLEDRARFLVNLEYFLTRHFKVETIIGHESQSAVELNWTVEH